MAYNSKMEFAASFFKVQKFLKSLLEDMRKEKEARDKIVRLLVPKIALGTFLEEDEGEKTEAFLQLLDFWSFSGRVYL